MREKTSSPRRRSTKRSLNVAKDDAAKTRYALRTTHYVSHHKSFLLLLIIFTFLTLYNSFRLPLGEAADETDHYQYLRFVARAGHPPLTEAERKEAGFKGGLAPLYYWLTAWPIAWVGEESAPDIRRVDARPERFIPTDGLGLNHVLHTLDEQWPWRGQPLAWHLVRLLSLPMAWATMLATYLLARRLFPDQKIIAVGAVAFMAFLPRFVISSAVINDDNLVFALIAFLLLTQVIILQGDDRPLTFAVFGALFGLALVTKYFSLILIPEILLTLFLSQKKTTVANQPPANKIRNTQYAIRNTTLAFLAALLLTAAPWFTFIAIRFNRIAGLGLIPGLAAALGEPQITEGLVGLLAGQSVRPPAATYPLPAWFSLLYRSFWFEYGWMRIFAPPWVYALFTIFLLLSLFGLIQKIRIHLKTPREEKTEETGANTQYAIRNTQYALSYVLRPTIQLLALHLTLFLFVVLARFILSATIDTGQGRHLYPALPVIALLVALGLNHLRGWPRRLHAPISPGQDLNIGRKTASPASPAARRSLFATRRSPFVPCRLLAAVCYLPPALISLFPAAFILPHYHTLPVTITHPDDLPITHRHAGDPTKPFFLAGFDVAETATAGDALPVTLYWRIESQVNRDYLVSLCLQDEKDRAVACWRGHFADGRYPGRAWEAGDTLADTIHIPLPTCYRLSEQRYRLQLEAWPLPSDSLTPTPAEAPIRRHTFAEPAIAIRATDSLLTDRPQTVDIWQTHRRLTDPTAIEMNQALTQITYSFANEPQTPVFEAIGSNKRWVPLPQFETMSYLPCAGGPTPFARLSHFVADAGLSPHRYQSTSKALPNLSLSLFNRIRTLAPITSTLSFDDTLTPLSLQLPDRPALDLSSNVDADPSAPRPHYQLPLAGLPLTIRWQARRWMADPLVVSLKLLDKDFTVGGERIAVLGDRYPNVLWVPTEVVEETYPLRLGPATPPGLYRLELSLIRQAENLPAGFEYLPFSQEGASSGPNLYPLTLRLLDPAHNSSPSHPVEAQLGPSIHLAGYDLQLPATDDQSPGASLPLTLYWRSTAKVNGDYTVFTQLIGPEGQVWAQWDNPPQAGRYPTGAWTEQDKVIDRYTLPLRENAPAGEYRLLVGMYDPTTGRRLPVTINGQPQPDQAIELTKFLLGNPN